MISFLQNKILIGDDWKDVMRTNDGEVLRVQVRQRVLSAGKDEEGFVWCKRRRVILQNQIFPKLKVLDSLIERQRSCLLGISISK